MIETNKIHKIDALTGLQKIETAGITERFKYFFLFYILSPLFILEGFPVQ